MVMAKAWTLVKGAELNIRKKRPHLKRGLIMALLASGLLAAALLEKPAESAPLAATNDSGPSWQTNPHDNLKCPDQQCNADAQAERRAHFAPARPIAPNQAFITAEQ